MKIELFNSFEGVTEYYGDIPESYNLPESQVDSTYYDLPENLAALSDFAMKVNDACDALLDIGDIDFFDVQKCKSLVRFLESYIPPENGPSPQFVKDLARYAKKAIMLKTGIVVEL